MKAYRWSIYPNTGGVLPKEHSEWYANQGRFYGFELTKDSPIGVIEYDANESNSSTPLCRFNSMIQEFEHRIDFDPTPTQDEPFGRWIWGKPSWL